MKKSATLICPRCKTSMPNVTVDEGKPFPNKCDDCGSTNVMVTHLVTNIRSAEEQKALKENRDKIDKAAHVAAEALANVLTKP